MFEVGQALRIKLPNGRLETVTIYQVDGSSVWIKFNDGGLEVVHCSQLVMLRKGAEGQ